MNIGHVTLVDGLSFLVCAAIALLCAGMMKEKTTLKCAPAHIGLGLVGFAASVSCVSLANNWHQAHWPGLALNIGLAACLVYIAASPALRARWDGTERRGALRITEADAKSLQDRFGRIE